MKYVRVNLTHEQVDQLAGVQQLVDLREPGTEYVIFAQIVLREPLRGVGLGYELLCLPAFGDEARALVTAVGNAQRALKKGARKPVKQ